VQKKTSDRFTVLRSGRYFLTLLLLVVTCMSTAQMTGVITNCPRSQKQAEVWYFGEFAGIDFRSGSAVPLQDENVMSAFKSTATICDSLGNLQFFTDGKQVWDRTFTLMPNATGLSGSRGATQPCIIIPLPGNADIYYVFTLDVLTFKADNTYTTKGLSYSVIDMSLRGGNGDATTTLNVPLVTPVCQKMTAVNNHDSSGTWVIVHKWDSDMFYAYLVDRNGLKDPVISSAGSVHGGGTSQQTNAEGFMKASPDGKKIALAITGDNKVELFDFDNATGKVSNGKTYFPNDAGLNANGIEFSADSKKLYVIMFQRGGSGPPTSPSLVYQYDISGGQLNNPVLVGTSAGIRLFSMQLAPDRRIYITRTVNLTSKVDSLDVIYNPERPGPACNFNSLNNVPDSRFDLTGGRYGVYSLPNFNQSYFNIPAFTWDSVCHGDVTRFRIINKANINSVMWDFGDGGTSDVLDPVHLYAAPGKYLVTLTQNFNGQAFKDSLWVTSFALPVISLVDTILLYSGASITLHAGGGFSEYLWSNGSSDSLITVGTQGSYRVRVMDNHCCTNADTTFVQVFKYTVPNAFTPNGDGINDLFQVNGLYKNCTFRMIIYDRWGQLLFESENVDKGWDGTYRGQACPPDSYVWVVYIGFPDKDITNQGDVVFKGTVILVK